MQTFLRPRAVASLLLCLAGCGGGGGSGGGGANGGAGTPSLSLTANPSQVVAGESSTLTWSATSFTTCSASGGWAGTRATSGSEIIANISATAVYELSCSSATGQQQSKSVQVTAVLPAGPVITMTGAPTLGDRGSSFTITWTTTGATSCYSEWPIPYYNRPVQGSEVFLIPAGYPSTRLNLTMTCSGPGGGATRTIVVPLRTLAGELRGPPGVYADYDVNDPAATYSSNDTQPAPIAPFGSFPGYVNVAGQGPPGRSFASGDQWDYFHISNVTAGQIARLILPTHDAGKPASQRDDADLFLYDWISRALIDASIGSGPEETLEFPADGSFVIGVKAERGGFNYLLSLEDPPLGSHANSHRLSAEFVPGEAIVAFASDAADTRDARAKNAASELRVKAGDLSRALLVELPTELPSAASAIAQKQTRAYFSENAEARLPQALRSKLATLREVKRLSELDDVRSASINRIVHAQLAPTDPLYARQRWHYESISLPAAWDITTGSSNVIVAVVDSGVVTNHPDLQAKLVDGYDMVDMDTDVSDPGYARDEDTVYHGTHVMGTVGAVANNGAGGAGVAWGARILPIRALSGRSGTSYDVMQAVRYAAGLPNDSGRVPAKAADIINLSLGTPGECTPEEAEVFTTVAARGIAVVASAGNGHSNAPHTPSTCPFVFGVAATGPGGYLAPYSNFAPAAVVAAPGGDTRYDADRDGFLDGIVSTGGDAASGGYVSLEGTSMAAPHVSGVFALMKSVKPALTPLEFRQLLQGGWLTDQEPSRPSPNDMGYGLINAHKAVRAANDNLVPPARVGASPGLLDFSAAGSPSATFNLRNTGVGALAITSVQSAAPWLTIAAETADANGLGTYRATVNSTGIPRGVHRAAVDIQSTAGPAQIPVVFTKLAFNIASNLGGLYLRVSDAKTGAIVRTRMFTQHNQQVTYRLDDVPLGSYIIVAGTDFNNDGNLCDAGELCGAYPVRSLPEPIQYTGVAQDINIDIAVTALERK